MVKIDFVLMPALILIAAMIVSILSFDNIGAQPSIFFPIFQYGGGYGGGGSYPSSPPSGSYPTTSSQSSYPTTYYQTSSYPTSYYTTTYYQTTTPPSGNSTTTYPTTYYQTTAYPSGNYPSYSTTTAYPSSYPSNSYTTSSYPSGNYPGSYPTTTYPSGNYATTTYPGNYPSGGYQTTTYPSNYPYSGNYYPTTYPGNYPSTYPGNYPNGYPSGFTIVANVIVANVNGNIITLGRQNIINATSFNSIPPSTARNISMALGIQISSLSNTIASTFSNNFGAYNSPKFGCFACNNTPPNSVIEGFVANASLAKAAFIKAAISSNAVSYNALAGYVVQNRSAFKQFVSNYTPVGFTIVNSSIAKFASNQTAARAAWLATGNVSRMNANISMLRSFSNVPNITSISAAQKLASAYIKAFFSNSVNVANETVTQQMYIASVINGNRTVEKYVPSNVTVYKVNQSAVVSITNLIRNVSSYVNINGKFPLNNISFSIKQNFTASAIGIKSYSANTTNLTVSGNFLPKPPGRTLGYVSINSTISDPSISSVNYTFNVSKAYLAATNINPNSMYIYRFNSTTSTWTKLPTTLVGSNSTNYFYKAKSPGISIYAISGTPPNSTTTTAATQNTPSANVNSTATAAPKTPSLSNPVLIGTVVLAIVIIAVIIYMKRPRRGS